jgi:hypothetical protein
VCTMYGLQKRTRKCSNLVKKKNISFFGRNRNLTIQSLVSHNKVQKLFLRCFPEYKKRYVDALRGRPVSCFVHVVSTEITERDLIKFCVWGVPLTIAGRICLVTLSAKFTSTFFSFTKGAHFIKTFAMSD